MKTIKKIFVFGNPDLKDDSLPLQLLSPLKIKFPQIKFSHLDPNENWELENELVILDTVKNIKKVQIFKDLKNFEKTKSLTLHDFDALTNLLWLKKLKKLKKITVIGLPADLKEKKALKEIEKFLN